MARAGDLDVPHPHPIADDVAAPAGRPFPGARQVPGDVPPVGRGRGSAASAAPLDPAAPLELTAGPVALTIVNGAVRWITVRGIETVRGIYGAVRDVSWGTVEPTLERCEATIGDDAFEVRFRAACVRPADGIDFAWTGTITGTREGTVRFVFDGAARATFLTPRIGLCVLHPPRLAGEPVEVTTLYGRLRGRFPDLVAGYVPFSNITRIRHDAVRLHETQIDFAGDVFQMEDQRAFGDASFKTFSRPLELPSPFRVDRGAVIRQVVTVSHPRAAAARSAARSAARPARPTRQTPEAVIRIGAATGRPVPAVGTSLPPPDVALEPAVVAALAALRPAHLRVTLDAAEPDTALNELARAAEVARATGAALEVALVAVPDAPAIDDLVGQLAAARVPVARLLPLDSDRHTTTALLAARARESLRRYALAAPITAASRGYLYHMLVEGLPAAAFDETGFPVNPQVRASDDASIIEALAILPAMVITAARRAGRKPVAVGPVSLRPLFDPYRVGPDLPVPPGGLSHRYDRRQPTLFAAAWTLGAAAGLAAAGAAAVTLHEAAGRAGLLVAEDHGGPPMPAPPGAVLPVGRVVGALAALAGRDLVTVEAPPPLAVLAARPSGDDVEILAANLGREAVRIEIISGSRARVPVERASIVVGERSIGSAWRPLKAPDRDLELPPFGVVRLVGRRTT